MPPKKPNHHRSNIRNLTEIMTSIHLLRFVIFGGGTSNKTNALRIVTVRLKICLLS